MNFSPCRTLGTLLLVVVFAGALRAAEKSGAGKIEVTLMGEVLRPGKVPVPVAATIEDALAAGGGFDTEGARLRHHGGPPVFCILMTRDHGVDMNMSIHIKVDRKSRVIRVADETQRNIRLKDGDSLIIPVITR